jgi:Domain of unknown function (DUF4388)
MKIKRTAKRRDALNPERLAELRLREKQILPKPSAEGYLQLAGEYDALGLAKEADRLRQLAEFFENENSPVAGPADGLLSGTADPVMLTEIIQILSRTKLSGDFVIDSQAQTFHLYFDHGQIINASSESDPAGVASFRRALRVPNGTYRFVKTSIDDVSRLINDGTDMLLLEAMTDADKQAAELSNL